VCRKFAADCPSPSGNISKPYVYIIQVIVNSYLLADQSTPALQNQFYTKLNRQNPWLRGTPLKLSD